MPGATSSLCRESPTGSWACTLPVMSPQAQLCPRKSNPPGPPSLPHYSSAAPLRPLGCGWGDAEVGELPCLGAPRKAMEGEPHSTHCQASRRQDLGWIILDTTAWGPSLSTRSGEVLGPKWGGWLVTRKQKLRGLLHHLLGDFGAHWRPLWPLGLGGLRAGGWRLGTLDPDVLLAVGGWDVVREGNGVHTARSCTEGCRNQGQAGITARCQRSGARVLAQLPLRLRGRLAQGTAGL